MQCIMGTLTYKLIAAVTSDYICLLKEDLFFNHVIFCNILVFLFAEFRVGKMSFCCCLKLKDKKRLQLKIRSTVKQISDKWCC